MAKRVLLVEDNPDFRYMLSRLLEMEGFTVIAVENSIKAFSLLYTQHPNVMVTDLGLPDISGLDLIAWVREKKEFEKLPIIALSGCGKPYLQAAIATGATKALDKTEDLEYLVQVLDRVA
jgi:two-component system CheB/CheR fusion protein